MKSAVLFLTFNRPSTTREVFEAIRKAQPPRLYISADAPRANRPEENARCAEVRTITSNIDWPCEVKTLLREKNLGCKYAVSSAIDWFFENEEQGIILEDDCLPANSFFHFCDEMLDYYKEDKRIWQISGSTFFPRAISSPDGDYFFSRYGPIWGWASWRRAWINYDVELADWGKMSSPQMLSNAFPDVYERRYKSILGGRLFRGEINTWDYQWGIIKNYNSGLTIIPKKNQIINIGFGDDATHTIGVDINAPLELITLPKKIDHPKYIVEDIEYGREFIRRVYKPRNFTRRLLSNLKNHLNNLR